MKVSELKKALAQDPTKPLRFVLPTGGQVPPHAHVTELARLDKQFVDCGGTYRTTSVCQLQTWFADDTEHRLDAEKLLKIFAHGAKLLGADDLEVEIEHEAPFIAHFPIESVETQGDTLVIRLGIKRTACLAPDQCVPPALNKTISFKPLPTFQATGCCS